MGLNDQVYRLQRAIEENKKQDELKTTKSTQEKLIKYQLLSLLADEIQEKAEEPLNLYTNYVKDLIITNILNNTDTQYLHNKEYTTYFLLENYERIAKKYQEKPNYIKQQKEAEKQKQQEEIAKKNKFNKILTIATYILLAPFFILGFFFVACATSASRNNKRII